MATRPPNQASGTGTAGNLSADDKHRPVKGKAKNRPAGTPTTPAARWNANKHHTVSYGDHLANVKAKKQLGTTDLTAPPSAAQAITEANSAADLQFGPQVRAAQQGLANVEPWFQQYMARVAGYATAAKTAMQPTLDQAGQLANPASAAQTQQAPGLDPNSEAGRASAMAAQGRAALAALGQQALQTNAQSTQDTFAGQGLIAQRELPQAQTFAQGQLANAQSDRGAAVTKFLTDARANAQNYAIARGTLGANIANSAADADAAAARTTETGRHNRASEGAAADRTKAASDTRNQTVNKYGYTNEQWQRFSAAHRQRIIKAFDSHGTGTDKAAEKHAKDITSASGRVQNTVQDIIDSYGSYAGKETDDTTKPIMKDGQPVKGPDGKPTYKGRKLTDAEIRATLGQNKKFTPQLIHIALMRKQGKKLGKSEIDYLHNLDPNIRIPRDWIGQERGAQGSGGNAPAQGGSRPT